MKRISIAVIFCVLMHTANSQVLISLVFGDELNTGKIEFGLDGGLSLSNLGGVNGAQNKSGFNLGFYFDIKTGHPSWMVSTGVVVKGPMGAKGLPVYSLNDPNLDSSFRGGTVTTSLAYFYVPVTMKYTFSNRIFLKGGLQLGLINSASDEFSKSTEQDGDLSYKRKRLDDYATLDAGLVAGIGYRLTKGYGMNIGINYFHGLIDVESDDIGPNQYNRAFYFNVGIPIGKGKAEKKKAAKEK